MAIMGIGIDIVEISRFQKIASASYGDKFLRKIFTPRELAQCGDSAAHKPARLAARFAVKEAFYKALTSELQKVSSWQSIQTLTDEGSGKPYIDVCDTKLKDALGKENVGGIHVSISHEKSCAVANVVLEKN